MEYVNPYTVPAHHTWVESGYCPAISGSKAWCNGSAGHEGPHHAPYLQPSGIELRVSWTDAENHPEPS